MPSHPVAAITAVLDPVALGELVTHSVGMATLGAHQGDEVQRAQVHLEILFEAVRLWHDVRTPRPVTVSIIKVQSGEERGGEEKSGKEDENWKLRERNDLMFLKTMSA